jgi:nitrite reductase (NADH) small subunit
MTRTQQPVPWKDVCHITDIQQYSGVATLMNGQQVAVFRLKGESEVYALSNYDPFSQAYVMARGLVGDKGGVVKVASPIYKQAFNLRTGECLDDDGVRLDTWETRVQGGIVQIRSH